MIGRVIGYYRVLEKIGQGGMGEVFRAHDERLGRDVAVKIIRPALADQADHLRRFEQEARAAAALNHPNIVAIYDVGLDNGSPYIVSELLEGETLRQRLTEGALPGGLVLDYARQVAQGLIAAHDRRIVHRDLKPENLFVTHDGRIKILDFGVAKLQPSPDEAARSVETMTTVTRTGTVVGTVAYMSPEQLRGKPVDHRSDIFSVGAILYEMLSGIRAFRGETEVDTITAVLREDPPDINVEQQAGISPAFQQVIRHCLEKEPENRFQSARDLAFALETLAGPAGGRTIAFPAPPLRLGRAVPWAVALLLALALLLLGTQLRREVPAPVFQRLTFEEGTIYSARFSPDGRSFVYGAAWNGQPLRLYSAVGDSLLSQPLSLPDASLLAISNIRELAVVLHGDHMAHLEMANGTLASAPLAGGSPRELLEDVSWADWDAHGELAVVHRVQGRYRIEYPIGHVLHESSGSISSIRFSREGDRIGFLNHPAQWDDRGSVCVVDLGGHETVLSSGWESADGLAWSSDGKEIWFTAAEKGFDRKLLAVNMANKVRTLLSIPGGLILQDVTPDGRALVSLNGERIAMAAVAREGKPIDLSWHDWNIVHDISRDGQSVLFEDSSEAAGPNYSVAIRKIDGTPPVRLGEGSAGGLSPDGKWAFSVFTGHPQRVTLFSVGPGQSQTIDIADLEIQNGPARFLPDGKGVTINANEPGHGVRCYLLDLNGGKPRPLTPEGIAGGLVSPDGRYILRADAAAEVAVYPLGDGSPRIIPGLEQGFVPFQWSEDSASIYGYHPGQVPAKVYKVNVVTGDKSLVQDLLREPTAGVVNVAPLVATRDGSRFAYSYYQVWSVLYLVSGLR
jgi:tRNA A-37 threonylcarbamoyl transferase component Bud32/Tol biopolymer transport system component